MEGRSRSKGDRREVHSLCMPVPTIVLNSHSGERAEATSLSHSKSAGDLDTSMDGAEYPTTFVEGPDMSLCVGTDGHGREAGGRTGIDLYCSPRLPRRSMHSEMCSHARQSSGMHTEANNSKDASCSLDPGSRVGSTISINSEYTSRSVGLISNDSSDSYYSHGANVMESSYQKHNLLRRFFSSPEKDDDVMQTTPVRRNSKSWGNLQDGAEGGLVVFDMGSDSTDDNLQPMDTLPYDKDEPPYAKQTLAGSHDDDGGDMNLVTANTGDISLRNGRIQKWLTEINDPVEPS